MTDSAPLEAEFGLAVYQPAAVEPVITAQLEAGVEASPSIAALPPLIVRFRQPDELTLAQIEATSRAQAQDLLKGQEAKKRYGLEGDGLSDEAVVMALSGLITAVESASLLFVDWNYATVVDGVAVKAPLTPAAMVELFKGRPRAKSAWLMHLDNASPMERAEGNASAASPDTTTDAAATTVGAASPETPPAPADSAAAPGSSAPASPPDP